MQLVEQENSLVMASETVAAMREKMGMLSFQMKMGVR